MINKVTRAQNKIFFGEPSKQSSQGFSHSEFAQNHQKKNAMIHSNHINQQSETIKQLLLDRFKHKKHILLQSSSIYIDTGQIKKKHSLKDKPQLACDIISTSLEKLPFLKKDQQKKFPQRLSQTIDAYSEFNKLVKSEMQLNPSACNLQSNTNLGKAKLHLSKRKSLKQANEFSSTFSVDDLKDQQQSNHSKLTNKSLFMGFNQDLKKRYLKRIVDRYFLNQQSPQKDIETYIQKYQKDPKHIAKFRHKTNKSTIIPAQKILKQSKLPLLGSTKTQSPVDQRQVRFAQKKEVLDSQELNSTSTQIHGDQLQNFNNDQINSNSSALSLSQSYLLEKIDEDQEEIDDFKGQDFYNNPKLENRSSSSYLPHSTFQSSSEFIMNSSSQDLFNLAKSSSLQNQPKSKEQRIKVYQNRSFSIFKIKHTSFQNLSQNHNLRTISVNYEFKKYFLNESSMELKRRQIKAKDIILSNCGSCFGQMWEQDMFDKTCIRLNITKNSPPCNGKLLPLTLSKMLYKISPQMQSGSSSFLIIKPYQSQKLSRFVTQYYLLSKSHTGLLSLILSISVPLSKLSGSLINNKLSINNIFYRDNNSYTINQWGYSYFRQDFLIQDNRFEKRQEPILKNQFGEWFVTPEYLAPELLENLCYSRDQVVKYWVKREEKKMQKSIVKEHDLFEYGNKADVWSLGLMILEIITLIPVWIGEKCIVENRTNPSIKPRRGLLHSQRRDLLKILTKQSYMKEDLNKIIRVESEPYQIQEWLLKLLHRMLELDAQKRISFDQIVQELQARLKK